ncbi:TMEM164 family acyltransferase [Solibacillus silvestris]|uniref:TMEM164 family acyltransferase n=1 Tax=Solibacillus silvestris TaxID=76853 RepID=UPI003F8054D8
MDGFSIFDSIHIAWLISISLVLIISIYYFRYLSFKQQQLFQRSVFWLLLFLEIAKQIYLIGTAQYSYWSPPLHLCGFGIFIIGWHAYFPNRTTATILYALTLPGAAIALLFPGWTMDPVGGFLHIHSFVFHALLVVYVFVLIFAKQLHTAFRDVWRAALFLAITVPPIYMYNARFQTNFMFLNKPVRGTPLQWLYDAFGASGYLVSLAVVIFLLWIMLYLFPAIRKRRE